MDGPVREPREARERSNKIPWAERPERPERSERERRERLERQERQEQVGWSGRSWYNGGPQGPWRGSSKGNNVGPKGKGSPGSGPPPGAGYEPREGGKSFFFGKDGKGRAEGRA